MKMFIKSKLLLGCLLIMGCSAISVSAHDHDDTKICFDNAAPNSLAGAEVVFQIEKTTTTFAGGYPYKGAVVKHYKKDGKFTAQGTGTMQGQVPDNQQYYYGNYRYQRTGFNTAVEKSVNISINNTPFTIKYTFETASSGKWEEDFGNGQLKLSGSFTIAPTDLPIEKQFAPAVKADSTVALIIKATQSNLPAGTYPAAGLVVQTYAQDGTMLFKGIGPGTLNSTGTYKYTKISANVGVEEVTQTSDFFSLPYTMVYTYETPSSGRWFQNFADGLIIFSGTFDTFSSK